MKNILFTIMISLTVGAGFASAAPIDLSTFTANPALDSFGDPVVTESGGTVTFDENMEFAAIYYADSAFAIPGDTASLSFDYSFTPGQFDYDDYFVLEVDFTKIWSVDTNGSGNVFIDFSAYAGQTVDIDWGLIWSGDNNADTVATISNINVGL